MMAPSITIRPARTADVDAVAALAKQLGHDAATGADRLSRLLARRDQQFLVADYGGRASGWIHMTRISRRNYSFVKRLGSARPDALRAFVPDVT